MAYLVASCIKLLAYPVRNVQNASTAMRALQITVSATAFLLTAVIGKLKTRKTYPVEVEKQMTEADACR